MSAAVVAALQRWRGRKCKDIGKPAYVVFDNKTLQAIAESKPASLSALGKVKGIGSKKLDDYGGEVLEIVRSASGGTASTSGPTTTSTLASAWGLVETPGTSSGVPTSGGLGRSTPTKMAPLFNVRGTDGAAGDTSGMPIPTSVQSVVSEMSAEEARGNYQNSMNEHQKQVVDSVLKEKRNVFFHGAAGTGKSFVLHTLIALLKEQHKDSECVTVTAPSGIAAVAVGGCTIHKFIGAGLCTGATWTVADKVLKSEKATKRWNDTRVLIVDEVSMLDADILQKLDFVGRATRDQSNVPFGGLQLVFTGDFYQLPPVCRGSNDPPFAFISPSWKLAQFRSIELVDVLRQKDPRLVSALNEVRSGTVPVGGATSALFRSLSRPLPPNPDGVLPTRLYSINANVDVENQVELNKLPGEPIVFEAIDTGDNKDVLELLRKNSPAAQTLTLKVGAQVVLLKNADDTLVNGSRGVVKGFIGVNDESFYKVKTSFRIHPKRVATADNMFSKWPLVAFDNGRVIAVGPAEFSATAGRKIYANRLQTPLKLAWALTVHKSQGMTLSRVEVNLRDAFDYGQVYVALSRATTIDGLRVTGFDERKIRAHPQVAQFYAAIKGSSGRGGDMNDSGNAAGKTERPAFASPSLAGAQNTNRTNSTPSGQCVKCGEIGHWARECPKVAAPLAGAGVGGSRFGGFTTCDSPSP